MRCHFCAVVPCTYIHLVCQSYAYVQALSFYLRIHSQLALSNIRVCASCAVLQVVATIEHLSATTAASLTSVTHAKVQQAMTHLSAQKNAAPQLWTNLARAALQSCDVSHALECAQHAIDDVQEHENSELSDNFADMFKPNSVLAAWLAVWHVCKLHGNHDLCRCCQGVSSLRKKHQW